MQVIPKQEAIAKLQRVLEQSKQIEHGSPEHIGWKRSAKVAVGRIFGEQSTQFKELEAALALSVQKAFLKSFLEEIKEYWDDEPTASDKKFRAHEISTGNLYDVFLSYSSQDEELAALIEEAVKAAGGKLFRAEKDLRAGDDFAVKIKEALRGARELWLLVSPNSLNSDWVATEWGAAWILDKRIVPILHQCRPAELPDRLRNLHHIDFYKYQELVKDTFSTESTEG